MTLLSQARQSLLGVVVVTALTACGTGPAPRIYVLHAPAETAVPVVLETNRPIIELKPVSVPDYLDTTDIVLRDGRNGLTISPTGRWGERLSVGVGQALGAALVIRLPNVLVVAVPIQVQRARRAIVDIEAVDVHPDGRCIMTVRWTVMAADRRTTLVVERATIVTQASQTVTDASIVAAMALGIRELADLIAVAIGRLPGVA